MPVEYPLVMPEAAGTDTSSTMANGGTTAVQDGLSDESFAQELAFQLKEMGRSLQTISQLLMSQTQIQETPNVDRALSTSPAFEPRAQSSGEYRENCPGIRFLKRETTEKGIIESGWHDPRKRKQDDGKTPPYWLTVSKVEGHGTTDHNITISDTKLRERISTVMEAYINHTNKYVWQPDDFTLSADSPTLIHNFDKLETEAKKESADETSRRLQEFVGLIRILAKPQNLPKAGSDPRNVRLEHAHIWTLYHPGRLVVSYKHGANYPQVFRVDSSFYRPDGQFTVFAWMWDWDGDHLTRSMYDFRIASYEDAKSPTELDCYPIEFYETENGSRGIKALQSLPALKNRRSLFLKYTFLQKTTVRVLKYSGIAFGDATLFPEDDIGLYYARSRGESRAERRLVKLDEDIVLDQTKYVQKVGQGRLLGNTEPTWEKFCKCDLCTVADTDEWFKTIDSISAASNSSALQQAVSAAQKFKQTEDDLLLPPRVFGFALSKKQWCQFFLNSIHETSELGVAEDGAKVEGLVFPSKVKAEERRDVFKLVSSHARVMSRTKDQRIADTIGGKGESLIFLFHGHSGIGKTLYAESLAKSCRLALFKVGTSDVGLKATKAERRLKQIFELADTWNAILLIDEADVLLDARGKENDSLVSKNALVSVLLREVEYFKGILIMTTNRVRAFDPAILSRIHHAVDFEETTQEQEMQLWNLWYERLKTQGLCDDVNDIHKWMQNTNQRKRRNFLSGREIRNVLLVAQSLAEQEGKDIRMTLGHLDRAYHYKEDFRAETEDKMRQAKQMIMSGARLEGGF